MTDYAIGDIQGCYDEFGLLLEKINFDDSKDCLWIVGDLINRGKHSLEVLRFLKQLRNAKIVLGNHDLHFLSVYYCQSPMKERDTFHDILNAKDCDDLAEWMRHLSLIHYDNKKNIIMSHAGIPPIWNETTALSLGKEVEAVLQGKDFLRYLEKLYGNEPACWSSDLSGIKRLRAITNYLTRMRYCDKNACLDLKYKGVIGGQPKGFEPWFSWQSKISPKTQLIFGHWASLNGECPIPNFNAIDTGCVWGNRLTALRLSDLQRFSIDAITD